MIKYGIAQDFESSGMFQLPGWKPLNRYGHAALERSKKRQHDFARVRGELSSKLAARYVEAKRTRPAQDYRDYSYEYLSHQGRWRQYGEPTRRLTAESRARWERRDRAWRQAWSAVRELVTEIRVIADRHGKLGLPPEVEKILDDARQIIRDASFGGSGRSGAFRPSRRTDLPSDGPARPRTPDGIPDQPWRRAPPSPPPLPPRSPDLPRPMPDLPKPAPPRLPPSPASPPTVPRPPR